MRLPTRDDITHFFSRVALLCAACVAVTGLWHLARGGGLVEFGLRLAGAATAMLVAVVFLMGGGESGAATLAGTARNDYQGAIDLQMIAGSSTAMGAEVRGAVRGALQPAYALAAFAVLLALATLAIRAGSAGP